MSKNKVKERCQKEEHAKFYYAAQKMFGNLKASQIILYLVAIVPVVLTFIPTGSKYAVLICSIISFGLSLLNESLTSFLNEYKKKAIMEYQLYETGITGAEFSKIEYDRETTNDLNELAIRRGLPSMRGKEKYNMVEVDGDISDEYSYIYLCRRTSATTRFLLSRIFYIYVCLLIFIAVCFVAAIFFKQETTEYLLLIITFYPLVSPIIKACGQCKECMRNCTKNCADIDNYFADGDISLERLARMQYYVQNLEFEMMVNRPAIYSIFNKMFKKGISDLEEGVTSRFKSAIAELKGKALMHRGIISQPKGKTLITKVDYDMDKLDKIEKKKNKSAKPEKSAAAQEKSAAQEKTGTKTTRQAKPAKTSQSSKSSKSTKSSKSSKRKNKAGSR